MGDAVIEQEDLTAQRPAMPALPPTNPGRHRADDPDPTPAWAQWLDEDHTPDSEATTRIRRVTSAEADLLSDDPMAPLVLAARERAAQTRRRREIRERAALAAIVAAVLAVIAGIVWVKVAPGDDSASQAAPSPTLVPAVPNPNQPAAPGAWCQAVESADRVSGSSSGNLNTAPGVIMHLEYAWYVLRDATVVRSLLTPDAKAAPEQATRDAISAVPAGTQHCVTISRLPADHWDVNIDERRPDGTKNTWQQTFTTTTGGDGRVLISSIISSGG
ncbi:hypothetical protein [Nocardia sp. NBC_01388]|uniref:hypothetical protein n=1 Tax=Nocardia sp. NBC_01388 TaxID=2903596 RepID=UPI00324AD2C9